MGLGLTELAVAMEALCRGGGGGGPAMGICFGLLGNLSILHHGNDEQKARYLPDMASGAEDVRLSPCLSPMPVPTQ